MPQTPQQAEDSLKAAQAALDSASTDLNRARTAARQDGPRPFGAVPTVVDAKAAYDAALTIRDVARQALADAQAAAERPLNWQTSHAAAMNSGR